MQQGLWLLALGLVAGIAFWLWHWYRRWNERARAAEVRFTDFMADAMHSGKPAAAAPAAAPAAPVTDANADLARQKLLFEAGTKAGEAGEPALAIQLYARLVARYPKSPIAQQARAAVESQKKRLKG